MDILFAVNEIDFSSPLGLMQISAMSKKRGDKNHLVVLSKENIFKKIEEINPKVIAYGGCTGEHKHYVKINKKIKERFKDIFTIMGGPHATFFPEVLEEAKLDAICIGEGEYAFVELLDCIEKRKDISGIENIVVKGEKLKGLRPLVKNLDELPFPERDLFNKHKEKKGMYMPIMSARGCPFSCTYCFNDSFKKIYLNEKIIRKRPVENILQEIKEAKKTNDFKYVRFVDDVFVIKEDDRFKEFCEKYPREIGLPFHIATRFDLITPNIVKSLKDAGCKAIFMSIESANPKIRKNILKRKITDKQILDGARFCKENGITLISYTMLGLPNSTLKDDINAVDLSIKAGVDVPEYPIYQPISKTELYEFCKEKEMFREEDIEEYGFMKHSILNCFSKLEKNAQMNIATLGTIAVKYPKLRNIIMNKLIYLPYNSIFKKAYALDKMHTYQSKVYPLKYSLRERVRLIKDSLEIEKIRRPHK